MKRVLLFGGSSGIGLSTARLLSMNGYQVTTPTRDEVDLLDPDQIDSLAMSHYDVVINCAAVNTGTYLGFYNNSTKCQIDQITVNFIAPVLLAKNYSRSNPSGHFVYISSASIDTPYLYNIVNATSKAALMYAMNVLRRELPNFIVSEICPGKTKTNMLKQNYNGTKSDEEIQAEYESYPYLTPLQVAKSVLFAVENQIDVIKLMPYE
jgi:short-subunit dehydrogenase